MRSRPRQHHIDEKRCDADNDRCIENTRRCADLLSEGKSFVSVVGHEHGVHPAALEHAWTPLAAGGQSPRPKTKVRPDKRRDRL
ncbi:hypothetical protein EDD25_2369 [Cryobacterium psychrophilum]|nr:hypothetical protein EDD25_2369 [Cryobacterium psychrophilum]